MTANSFKLLILSGIFLIPALGFSQSNSPTPVIEEGSEFSEPDEATNTLTTDKSELDFVEKQLDQNIPELSKEDLEAATERSAEDEVKAGEETEISTSDEKAVDTVRDTAKSWENNKWAAVQRNFMPKTSRFQILLAGSLVPTDVFYKTYGGNFRAGYHFNEKWGLELSQYLFSSSRGNDINSIENNQQISVKSVTSVRNLLSLNLYFNHIYGKIRLIKKTPRQNTNLCSISPMKIFWISFHIFTMDIWGDFLTKSREYHNQQNLITISKSENT